MQKGRNNVKIQDISLKDLTPERLDKMSSSELKELENVLKTKILSVTAYRKVAEARENT